MRETQSFVSAVILFLASSLLAFSFFAADNLSEFAAHSGAARLMACDEPQRLGSLRGSIRLPSSDGDRKPEEDVEVFLLPVRVPTDREIKKSFQEDANRYRESAAQMRKAAAGAEARASEAKTQTDPDTSPRVHLAAADGFRRSAEDSEQQAQRLEKALENQLKAESIELVEIERVTKGRGVFWKLVRMTTLQSSTTNAEGGFAFANVHPGEYLLACKLPPRHWLGYWFIHVTVTEKGQAVDLTEKNGTNLQTVDDIIEKLEK